jgi:membrane protein required for colicin V production
MNWADWTILAILVISSLISLKRGFVKEALSLVVWVLAFMMATIFSPPLEILLESAITTPSIRQMTAFGILFASTLIVGAMVNYLIGEVVKMTGLSGTDRLLGMIFGLARGAIVVMAILLLLPGLIPVDQDPWWYSSSIIPYFLTFEDWARNTASLIGSAVYDIFSKL